jgi:hypothetical protein
MLSFIFLAGTDLTEGPHRLLRPGRSAPCFLRNWRKQEGGETQRYQLNQLWFSFLTTVYWVVVTLVLVDTLWKKIWKKCYVQCTLHVEVSNSQFFGTKMCWAAEPSILCENSTRWWPCDRQTPIPLDDRSCKSTTGDCRLNRPGRFTGLFPKSCWWSTRAARPLLWGTDMNLGTPQEPKTL